VLASPGCGASACRVPVGEGVTLPILAAEDLAVFKVIVDRWRDWTDIEEMLVRAGHRLRQRIGAARWLQRILAPGDERPARIEELLCRPLA